MAGYLEADVWGREDKIVAVHNEGETHKEQSKDFRCGLLLCYN